MTELLPCPFCGGEASLEEYPHHWAVECTECEMSAPCEKTAADAVRAWNTRYERTCRPVVFERPLLETFVCSECGAYADVSDDCGYCSIGIGDVTKRREEFDSNSPYRTLRYCPNCGAKVVGE